MTEAEAKKALEEADLVCVVGQPAFYEDVEPGMVGGMSVQPETRIEKGASITISLCKEPEPTTEPTTAPTTAPPTESTPPGESTPEESKPSEGGNQ